MKTQKKLDGPAVEEALHAYAVFIEGLEGFYYPELLDILMEAKDLLKTYRETNTRLNRRAQIGESRFLRLRRIIQRRLRHKERTLETAGRNSVHYNGMLRSRLEQVNGMLRAEAAPRKKSWLSRLLWGDRRMTHPLRETYRGLLEQLQERHETLAAGFPGFSIYRRAKEAIETLLNQIDPDEKSIKHVQTSLLLIGGYEHVTEEEIRSWSPEQREEVYWWVQSVFDNANDNLEVEVPPKPDFLPEPLGWGECCMPLNVNGEPFHCECGGKIFRKKLLKHPTKSLYVCTCCRAEYEGEK